MQLEVGPEVLKVVVVGQLVGNVHVQGDGCLEGPAAGHVADGVAAATQQHQRQLVPARQANFKIARQSLISVADPDPHGSGSRR